MVACEGKSCKNCPCLGCHGNLLENGNLFWQCQGFVQEIASFIKGKREIQLGEILQFLDFINIMNAMIRLIRPMADL